MPSRPVFAGLCVVAIAAVTSTSVAAQSKIHLREVCDSQTVFTLVGADLETGRILLALRSAQPPIPGWLVELETEEARAHLHFRDPAERRASGSVAPGPVLTAVPCGSACRRIEAWEDGEWVPIGAPLSVSDRGTLQTGYDAGGRPWAVVVEATDRPGRVRVTASRLEARIWRPAGRALADSVGFPAVQASPADAEAILVGSQRFSLDAPPRPWLRGVPQNGRGSQVVAITADAAAWLGGGGSLMITRDRGRTWRRSSRTRKDEVGGWVHELRADLPLHLADGEFPTLWTAPTMEDAGAGGSGLDLTSWSAGDSWRDVARLPAAYPRGLSPEFQPQHILVDDNGRWILVGSCVDTPTGAALELLTVDAQGRAKAVQTRLDPAWLAQSTD